MSPKMPGRLPVKGVAGVTLRTARYHHSIGVLPEPPRGGSGYRRYGGKEVIELVQAGRLRALGMPLPRIAQRQRVSAGDSDDVLPSEEVDGQVDTDSADLLLTDRLDPSQQRFMHRLPAHVEGTR